MIPQSQESKKIAKTAQAMIRDFGGNAVIEAHEAAAATRAGGDLEGEAFFLAVARKVEEFYGR